jgi:outer membrane protein assembly factor BamB
VVYIGSYDHKLYAFNATTGAVLWSYTTESNVGSDPTVVNGVIYIGSLDHMLYAFHLSSDMRITS